MAEKRKPIDIRNKKATFNFHIENEFTCGMMLKGTEVKSIRNGDVNLNDAYCYYENNELFVKNMYIGEWKQGSYYNHEPRADRKLLLNRNELRKISIKLKDKGYACFPTRLFENDKGIFKLEIAVGRGKKQFDKREDLKEKDTKRELERFVR